MSSVGKLLISAYSIDLIITYRYCIELAALFGVGKGLGHRFFRAVDEALSTSSISKHDILHLRQYILVYDAVILCHERLLREQVSTRRPSRKGEKEKVPRKPGQGPQAKRRRLAAGKKEERQLEEGSETEEVELGPDTSESDELVDSAFSGSDE